MRHFSPLFLLFWLTISVSAQDSLSMNNQYLLGGSINFSVMDRDFGAVSIADGAGGILSSTNLNSNLTSFFFSPYVGKQIKPNLILGIRANYGTTNQQATNIISGSSVESEIKRNSYGIEVFSRHIFKPENKFNFFLEPWMGYNLSNIDTYQDGRIAQEEESRALDIGIGAGLQYSFTKNLRGLMRFGGISYINGNTEISGVRFDQGFSTLNTNLNLQAVSIGFELRL